ncbi:pseudoazurin [Roseovarius dicentrarchi]|uniref:pseudoazurin n=1 Tax=Roseovarius dicentrarchi TaxID=2250573 RepID=UPI001EF05410|nr:pseudoazurin [Roseovarius dicentrarchi]
MFYKTTATLAAAAMLLSGAAWAETVEVKMLNRGEAGTMVFEPAFVQIAPGDTVKFVPTDKSHNAESMEEMMPEGAEPFKGKINEEIDVTFDVEGLYGVKCLPHFAMGMVMTIAVGENVEVPADYLEGRLPRNAKKRFEEQLENL